MGKWLMYVMGILWDIMGYTLGYGYGSIPMKIPFLGE